MPCPDQRRQRIVILGATGSVGSSALAVLRAWPQRFEVVGLSAHHEQDQLEALAMEFACQNHWLSSVEAQYRSMLAFLASEPIDAVLVAIAGSAALQPTLAALVRGRRLLLASKEVLVMAGELVMTRARELAVDVVPIDSEHSAVLQCWPQALESRSTEDVEAITLTASGGPFWHHSLAELANVSVEQACAHPRWSMGRKISVDSATMMNKALEVIEAAQLFALPAARIKVLVHPQSIVHALVRYQDGVELAQLCLPDMRSAIAYALSHPQRLPLELPRLDLAEIGELSFYQPDPERFRAPVLAFQALESANGAAIALNAANETAVQAFLAGEIKFVDIVPLAAQAMEQLGARACADLAEIIELDTRARALTRRAIAAAA